MTTVPTLSKLARAGACTVALAVVASCGDDTSTVASESGSASESTTTAAELVDAYLLLPPSGKRQLSDPAEGVESTVEQDVVVLEGPDGQRVAAATTEADPPPVGARSQPPEQFDYPNGTTEVLWTETGYEIRLVADEGVPTDVRDAIADALAVGDHGSLSLERLPTAWTVAHNRGVAPKVVSYTAGDVLVVQYPEAGSGQELDRLDIVGAAPVRVRGKAGWLDSPGTTLWWREDQSLVVRLSAESRGQLMALARELVPASESEWEAEAP